MRSTLPRALVVSSAVAVLTLSLPARPAAADSTRVLRMELPGGPRPVRIENLVGKMRVRSGTGDRIVVAATIHAGTETLAGRFRLENVGTAEHPIVRVRYPESESSIRYRSPGFGDGGGLFESLFDSSDNRQTYDGRSFRIRSSRGTILFADLDVEIPRGAAATMSNLVGLLSASDVEGRLGFEVDSADIRLDRVKGDVEVQGSSGDIQAADIEGTWSSRFSSGDLDFRRFHGLSASFESGSGDVRARDVKTRSLRIDTKSGDVRVDDVDAAEIEAHTGSGDVVMSSRGTNLARLRARTGSGDLALKIPRDTPFDASTEMGSGDLKVGFLDGAKTKRHGELVAYRRGEGTVKIELETGSGNISIDPR